MKETSRTQLANETIRAYFALSDAIRLATLLATLPNWITTDLTISQLKAVFLLAHHGVLTIGELAGRLGMGNPAASVLVQQLVEQELVERAEDIQDRRRMLVSLTTHGAKLISGRREQVEAKLLHWLCQLDDGGLSNLLHGLNALVEIVQSEPAEASETGSSRPLAGDGNHAQY